jgi:predicted ATP-dependent serine protease
VRQSEYIDLIPLSQAVLCENCGQISNRRKDRCAGCGSIATLDLACILDGSDLPSHISTRTLNPSGSSANGLEPQRATN